MEILARLFILAEVHLLMTYHRQFHQ